ncbi:MAG TPA: nucleotidyltransferase domain-containing protein [Thermoanaerobaculia bacterium]|nr:nucleotidyltransferase domain-containing protein [Thermoanaerobaculia bacterium]
MEREVKPMQIVESSILDPLLQAKRQKILSLAARHGARSLKIFGSFARGEAHAGSDVDFLVLRK